ncbi:MAG: hypothetical protein E7Y34_02150, partial [Mycoplasma sp.]|nr:hypothetical protein [Mycoplasma sp.]
MSSSDSVKKLGLSGDISKALSKVSWNSLDDFYTNLETYVNNRNSNPGLEPYYTIYDQLMKKAMRDEGLIFSISGLFAAFVSGPFLVSFVNRKKSYKIFALPVIFVFGFLILAVAPWLSSAILMYAIFCPIFGIGYGYRTLMDPWGTTVSRKTNVAIGFVRSFYEIGSALGTFFLTFYLFKAKYYKQTLTIQTAVPYFVSGLAVLSLGIFLFFYMPDNVFSSSHIEDAKYGEKVEESNILNKQIKLKDIVFSRGFIVGLISFIFLIGPIQAFNSIWVNTVENFTTEQNLINNVNHIGYQKLFSVVFRLIFAFLILKKANKFKLKNIIMFASLLAGIAWITIGFLVYKINFHEDKMILVDLIGALAESLIATLSVALGYEFVS